MEITLDQLLTSRENRHARQQELLRQYPGQTLLCITVIIPGSVKRNTNSLIIAGAATTAVVNTDHGTFAGLITITNGYRPPICRLFSAIG